MIISCPQCRSRYRIDPAAGRKSLVRVKCPGCQHTFEVAIEVKPPDPPTDLPGTTPPANGAAARSLVLVVDDARFFREMIRDLLSELPITVETAADGEEAWRKIQSLQPALLLLDLNIPGMSGQELIAAVRSHPDGGRIRILAMSGVQRGEEAARDLRRLGADDFISKSFKPRDLQNRICTLLGL